MTINIGVNIYDNVSDDFGRMSTKKVGQVKKDTTVMLKDVISVRLKVNRENIELYYSKEREASHFKPD